MYDHLLQVIIMSTAMKSGVILIVQRLISVCRSNFEVRKALN